MLNKKELIEQTKLTIAESIKSILIFSKKRNIKFNKLLELNDWLIENYEVIIEWESVKQNIIKNKEKE